MVFYIGFPLGTNYGWGVCGRYCALEMARIGETRLLPTSDPRVSLASDPLAAIEIFRLMMSQQELAALPRDAAGVRLNGPLLHTITNKTMASATPGIRGTRNVGYTFFEENILEPALIETARRTFDHVATGSSWCTEILREYGLPNVSTVIQGVDRQIFLPRPEGKTLLRDRFVVFSGGKFEFRKGQDVVIRAYKVLQDRHNDVMLVNAWHNHWNWSRDTMASSPLIRFRPSDQPHGVVINNLLGEHGIDLARVVTLPAMPNVLQAQIYHNTDVGLFPNRSEGGTNLVLMEYLACGKPVIATATTGHRDVVTPRNALVIPCPRACAINDPAGKRLAEWPEPDLDETIARLEFAYQNRWQLQALGAQGGIDMGQWPWSRTASEFGRLMA